jgi:hypothetical protein
MKHTDEIIEEEKEGDAMKRNRSNRPCIGGFQTGAVYEVRTYGSVRGIKQESILFYPTR